MRRVPAATSALLLLSLVGCDAEPDRPSTSSAGGAPFEVHEWGVVDVPAYGATEVAGGAGRPRPDEQEHGQARKPVLYFHLDSGADPIEIEVGARIPGGRLHEHWPSEVLWHEVALTPEGVRWPRARLARCGSPLYEGERQPPPRSREATCDTPDSYCEINDLPLYLTTDASCLTYHDVDARLLFYRGSIGTPRLPIAVSRNAAGRTVLRADAPSGARMLYVVGGRGVELPWPAPGAEVAIPEALTESLDGGRLASSMARLVTEAGLTTEETGAFMRAWSESFFGVPWPIAAEHDRPGRESPAGGASPMRHSTVLFRPVLLYVMPEATVSAVAELDITPAPRVIRRVMVVRVDLPAS